MSASIQPYSKFSLRSIFQNSIIYSVSDILLKIVGFILIPLYTRVLTPEDYGIVGYVTAFIQILSPLLSLGLINTLPVLYHAYSGEERQKLISTVVNFTLIYSLVITLTLLFLGNGYFSYITNKVSFNPYIQLGLISIFFSSFYYLPLGIFNMEEKPVKYAAYSIGLSLLSIVLNILFVVILHKGAYGVLLASLLSGIIGMFVAIFTIRKVYKPLIKLDKLTAILVLALPALPHLFTGTLWRFADRFFITNMSNLSATGVYSLAMTISSVLIIVMGGMTTALNPQFYKRAYSYDKGLPSDWGRLFSLFLCASSLIGLGMAILSPEIIKLLAPANYYKAIPLLPILTLGQGIIGITWFIIPAINYTKKTWVYPLASFPATTANIILNIILIPKFGEIGAAWAMVLTGLIQLSIFTFFSQIFYRVPYEKANIAKILALSSIIFILAQLIDFSQSIWFNSIYKLLLLVLMLFFLWLLNFFRPYELEGLKGYLADKVRYVRGFCWGNEEK